MSTGTGIFLAGLIIGIVMLYGQTKDRWDWSHITKKIGIVVGVTVLILSIVTYHFLNGWKAFDVDLSLTSILYSFATFFFIGALAVTPHLVIKAIFEKGLNKNFEFDEEWNERFIHKFSMVVSYIILWFLLIFFFDEVKENLIWFLNRPTS